MGVNVEWDNGTETVLRQTFEGQWQVQDWERVEDATYYMLQSAPWAVDIVYDGRASDPQSFLDNFVGNLPGFARCWRHPTIGRIIVIPPAQVFNKVESFLSNLGNGEPNDLGWRLRVQFSLDEARASLNGW